MSPFALIGVDGGATEVKVHAVACEDLQKPAGFALGPEAASRTYERLPGFEPIPVAHQLAQARQARAVSGCSVQGGKPVSARPNRAVHSPTAHAGRDGGSPFPGPTVVEDVQGELWVRAAAEAVADVAGQCGSRRVLVGIGMPGLKTPDRRGVSVLNNGPRMPTYLDRFEQCLAELEIELAEPVAALGSDADYCGLGEEHAAEGLFRDVESAYYVGCGTGVADAMKLRGRLVPFDDARAWALKAWQIPAAGGLTFERLVSARAMNDRYAERLGADDTGKPRFPEVDAAAGVAEAVTHLDEVARTLADLIFERMDTIKNGRRASAERGEAYAALNTDHEFRGTLLDRVVVGQQLGRIYGDRRYADVFAAPLHSHLAGVIRGCGDRELIRHCLEGNGLRPGLLRASALRAAPALGAAVAAVRAMRRG